MEIVTGLSLAFIFLHNNNWWRFYNKYHENIRLAILISVIKMLACRSELLGFQRFTCPRCQHTITVPFSCKSKFCNSCGKKATDNWIVKNYNVLPKAKWQHITFTIPAELRDFFWLNRYLFNLMPAKAASVIKKLTAKKGIMPGMFVAIHSFGRDLKHNVHIHLSVILGGLTNNKKWRGNLYFHHLVVKNIWRYIIINMFRELYNSGNLILTPELKHIKDYKAFNSWLNFLYNKKWVVFLQKPSTNHKRNIDYLGKYIKRPPIGEARIKKYDGKYVTFEYLDHYDNTKKNISLPIMAFIAKVISHIHDINFRCIRYFGFLANRVRGKLLPIVHQLLQSKADLAKKSYISWRNMITYSFGYDPLLCPNCQNTLLPSGFSFRKTNLIAMHQQIACR